MKKTFSFSKNSKFNEEYNFDQSASDDEFMNEIFDQYESNDSLASTNSFYDFCEEEDELNAKYLDVYDTEKSMENFGSVDFDLKKAKHEVYSEHLKRNLLTFELPYSSTRTPQKTRAIKESSRDILNEISSDIWDDNKTTRESQATAEMTARHLRNHPKKYDNMINNAKKGMSQKVYYKPAQLSQDTANMIFIQGVFRSSSSDIELQKKVFGGYEEYANLLATRILSSSMKKHNLHLLGKIRPKESDARIKEWHEESKNDFYFLGSKSLKLLPFFSYSVRCKVVYDSTSIDKHQEREKPPVKIWEICAFEKMHSSQRIDQNMCVFEKYDHMMPIEWCADTWKQICRYFVFNTDYLIKPKTLSLSGSSNNSNSNSSSSSSNNQQEGSLTEDDIRDIEDFIHSLQVKFDISSYTSNEKEKNRLSVIFFEKVVDFV